MRSSKSEPDIKMLRSFGLLMGAVVVMLFGILIPWIAGYIHPVWPWMLAVIFWLTAMIKPLALRTVYMGWMAIGHVLGWVNTRIILIFVYFIIVMPIGLIMRVFRHDPLLLKLNKEAASYRVKSKQSDKDHMEKPF